MPPKIKKHNVKNNKIKKPSESNNVIDYPIFCFKHLIIKPKEDHKFYTDFIIRLNKLCNLGWNEINKSHKHSFGTEKIPTYKLKPALPAFISPDIDSLIVFRANGDNRPFLGIRKDNVFHIVFIEENFGDVYDHN